MLSHFNRMYSNKTPENNASVCQLCKQEVLHRLSDRRSKRNKPSLQGHLDWEKLGVSYMCVLFHVPDPPEGMKTMLMPNMVCVSHV